MSRPDTATGTVRAQVLTFKDLYSWQSWQFVGAFSASGRHFVGTATGSYATQTWYSGWGTGPSVSIQPFTVTSTKGRGSLSGTCSGTLSTGNQVADLSCALSVDGAPTVTMLLVAPLTSNDVTNSCDLNGSCVYNYVGPFVSR